MSEGWIKLHRKIIDSRVFANEGLLKVWVYCLCRANHEKNYVPFKTGKGESEVKVEPGQFIFGRKSAAKDLRMNGSTVYKRIKKLESMGNITIQSNTHYSIVSVCNWETYQESEKEKEQPKGQPSNNQVTTKYQPSNTDKNDNNEKNDKKVARVNGCPIPEALRYQELKEKYEFYCKYMKENYNRWPTSTTTQTDLHKLLELKKKDNDPVKVIEQTIQARNKTFYELRNFDNGNGDDSDLLDNNKLRLMSIKNHSN